MTDRLDHVVEANGGLQRWNELDTVSARFAQGDVTWEMVSQKGVLDDIYVAAPLAEPLLISIDLTEITLA